MANSGAPINFYELNESAVLSSKSLEAGSFICCKDSTNMYMVPTTGGAPVKMAETTLFLTDAARQDILAPINGKKYFCYDTGKMWVYYNGWICINPDVSVEYTIENVVVPPSGSVTVSDSRIKSTSNCEFIPDASVADLISGINAVAANGSATITGTTKYDIPGILKVKC